MFLSLSSRRRRRAPRWLIPILALAVSTAMRTTAAFAEDRVFLTSGERLTGALVEFEKDELRFKSKAAGEVVISRSHVAALETDADVTIVLRDGNALTGRLGRSSGDGGTMRLMGTRDGVDVRITFDDIVAAFPGTKDRSRGFRWSGRLNLGLSATSGNSDTDSVHMDGESSGRAPEDRISVSGEFNTQSDQGSETINNARLDLKHDHFVSEKVYFYTNAAGERDEFKDLNLRTTLGTGIGYQFFETKTTKLSFEGGPAYRNEDFEEAPDSDSIAARWAVDFKHDLPRRIASIFHFHEGVVDLDDTSNLVLRSRSGVRVPFGSRFNATFQVDLDYDNKPAPGTEKTDKAYMFTLGYVW